jgi:hypothetical protein
LGDFSPYGRLLFKGIGGHNGEQGLLLPDTGSLHEYYLDISELPTMPASWRIDGNNTSILDVIDLVASTAGYDYYIELVLVKGVGLSSSGIAKFIKIRSVSRNTQPTLGNISQFISDQDGFVIDSTEGQELRNEVTSSFMIGGQKNTLYQVEQTYTSEDDDEDSDYFDDAILPYFGKDSNDNSIIPTKDSDGDWQFDVV